ncbi:hAT family C-terminal dimerization region [Popillia japonica]|uniref:HAT family C-terminal dimerization region n=1 Tax=Popillia japonica TaxID=7064 RepID=A0AAW1JDH5_POPJA
MKLAFLCDITEKLNQLNLNLLGKDRNVIDLTTLLKTFKSQSQVHASQLRRKNMEEECTHNSNRDFETFARQLENLHLEFERRFLDFVALEEVLSFMAFPSNESNDLHSLTAKIGKLTDSESVVVEEEIIKMRCGIFLNARAFGSNTDFWKLICKEKFPCLRKVALYLTSFFGSTYLCESTFSTMNTIKTKHRSRLTDAHLTSSLRIAVTSYTPQYNKLVENMQCQISTQKPNTE